MNRFDRGGLCGPRTYTEPTSRKLNWVPCLITKSPKVMENTSYLSLPTSFFHHFCASAPAVPLPSLSLPPTLPALLPLPFPFSTFFYRSISHLLVKKLHNFDFGIYSHVHLNLSRGISYLLILRLVEKKITVTFYTSRFVNGNI